MDIKQIYDERLAHASYVIHSEGQVIVIDPARDPQAYYDYAKEKDARIVGVIETHPHADFISSHLEIHQETGATIYASALVDAAYPHQSFDEGDVITFGALRLRALNTPGHSPDSISVVLADEGGKNQAVFTGDTLFVGDVGRPDLRENANQQQEKKERFARQLYHSLRDKLMPLADEVTVYPAHGAGSLCGKGMSDERTSTIGKEKKTNPGLQEQTETEFVEWLLEDQLFIPEYFSYDVALNKKGVAAFLPSVNRVPRMLTKDSQQIRDGIIIDVRKQADFKKSHVSGAINIMLQGSYETWLGSLVAPDQSFYLIAESEEGLMQAIRRAAKIGYETKVKGALLHQQFETTTASDQLDLDHFRSNPKDYTVVDIRNVSEVVGNEIFDHAIAIPLHELQDRWGEIPDDKPIVVHCGSGYRSAAGASILAALKAGKTKVYDLSDHIKSFKKEYA